MSRILQSYLKFAYGSFFKPHTGDGAGDQQDALESFYNSQADAYDTTRTRLLRGRDDMVRLVAAQMKYKQANRKQIWVDIGGGTGWTIEQMGKHLDVPSFFTRVYLVDLTPSLLRIAKARFERLGWTNIEIVCEDCRHFNLQDREQRDSDDDVKADLITMSYSLTMIPDFFSVIDMATSLLNMKGIIGVVDFYAQTEVDFMRRDYVGGFLDRHCAWLNRTFWRIWFEQDRVMFDGGRRDYLEYRFGTRLSINKRNAMLPGLRIPFYIWIGCNKNTTSLELDVSSVTSLFSQASEGCTRRRDVPLPSVYYQNQHWRTYYHEEARPSKIRPKGSEPADANAEDVQEILRILSVKRTDRILAHTRTGNFNLFMAVRGPASIHFVSPDASQNHLLELKFAALQRLDQEITQEVLEKGLSRDVLMDKLSPCMSSQAIQYCLNHGSKGCLSRSTAGPKLEYPNVTEVQGAPQLPLPKAFSGLRIHTDDMHNVLARSSPGSLTVVVAGDLLRTAIEDPLCHIRNLSRALAMNGRVLVESPRANPCHASEFEKLGFEAVRHGSKYWVYTKLRPVV